MSEALSNVAMLFLMLLPLATATIGWAADDRARCSTTPGGGI